MTSKASKSTRVKVSRKTISDNVGKVLGPPCAEELRHTIDAANSLEKAHAASLESAVVHFPKSYRFKESQQRRFRDKLWATANLYRKNKIAIEDEFRSRWFVWRAIFPISLILGVRPDCIFGSAEPMFVPRALAIWIAAEAGDVSASDIAKVVGRDRATVTHSIKRAKIGVADPDSGFYKLMADLIQFESEELWASRKSSPPANQE